MKKYLGKKISTAIFISGRGSNLKNLIKFSKSKTSPIQINFIFSNKKNSPGFMYARNSGFNTLCLPNRNFISIEKKLLQILNKKKIKLICLAGFMKILSSNFIKKFRGKIINIHPSLLPKYKGLNTHIRVLRNREKYSGCTVHFVNSKLDSGKIILQKKVKIRKNDTAKKLSKRILFEEHRIYPKAIIKISS